MSILTNYSNPKLAEEIAADRMMLQAPGENYLVLFNTLDVDGRFDGTALLQPIKMRRVFHDYFVSVYQIAALQPLHR